MVAAAIAGGSVVSAGASLLGGSTAAGASQQAAQTQLAAQQSANATSLQEQANAEDQAMRGLDIGSRFQAPFYDVGLGNLDELSAELRTPGTSGVGQMPLGGVPPTPAIPSLTDPTQLPGYSFTLDQGLKATQNAAAAQGLGVSGPALKGATTYAEGLAGTYYNNYLQNYWTNQNNYLSNYWSNQNNRYNMLYNLAGIGTGAANQISTAATSAGTLAAQASTAAGNQIANTTTQTAANAGAAQQAAGNLLGSSFSGAGSSIGNALTTYALLNNPNTGATVSPAYAAGVSQYYGTPANYYGFGGTG